MNEWKLAEAKNRFSELVNNALAIGPQLIKRRNDTVMVISKEEYDSLTGKSKGFKAYLLQPPHKADALDFQRDRSTMRDVDL